MFIGSSESSALPFGKSKGGAETKTGLTGLTKLRDAFRGRARTARLRHAFFLGSARASRAACGALAGGSERGAFSHTRLVSRFTANREGAVGRTRGRVRSPHSVDSVFFAATTVKKHKCRAPACAGVIVALSKLPVVGGEVAAQSWLPEQ